MRFYVEIALTAVTAGLAILTLWTREWIEALTGTDPDGGSGSLEWTIVAAFLVVTLLLAAAARAEWRRSAPA